jgi:PAS domain S-box-containing protein
MNDSFDIPPRPQRQADPGSDGDGHWDDWRILPDENGIPHIVPPGGDQDRPEAPYTGPSAQQREILDLVHDAVFVYDFEGRILYWNPASERLYGWSAKQVSDAHPHSLLRTRMPKPAREIYRQLLEEGHWEGELTHTSHNAKTLVVHSRWALLRDEQGRPRGVLEINSDITPRKSAQRKLQAEWHRFASVLGMLPGYVAMKDTQGTIRFANRRFFDLYGTPGGRPSWQVQPNRTEKGEKRMLNQVLSEQITQAWEQRLNNGRTYHVAVCPFVDTDSTPVVLEMGIDVTQRKEAEWQIARISEQQRRTIGRDLHDSVGQKLTGLRFLLETLVKRVSDALPDQAPLAGEAQNVLQDAVAQVRALARGLDPLGLEGEEISDLLAQLARDTQRLFDIECKVNCQEGLTLNPTQELQLYRIAQEAVSNAARHGGAKAISIDVHSNENGIILSISDDGRGFHRPNAARQGLGVETMRHRAAVINAVLQIESTQGEGTVVRCQLPSGAQTSGEQDGFNFQGS